MIEVFTDNGVNQVRTRTNDEATDSRGTSTSSEAQDQSCKNSHGVETYKFFQNWLRVPDGVPLPAYIPGNRECALMGNGVSHNNISNKKRRNNTKLAPPGPTPPQPNQTK